MGSKENLLCFLAICSVLVSIYLVYDHIKDEDASFCDIGAAISCSKIRKSVFSEILRVPIAVFGVIFNLVNLYSFIILARSKDRKKYSLYLSASFYWNVIGCFFVFYLIGAEIYLQSICPLCTVIHILQIASLLLLYPLHFNTRSIPSLLETISALKKEILIIGIIHLIPLLLCNTLLIPSMEENVPTETMASSELSECLAAAGWTCFGRSGCSWCDKQIQLFSQHRDSLQYVDCNHSNWQEKCLELQVKAFPSWIRLDSSGNELERWKGFAPVETLVKLSSCTNGP